MSRLARQLTEMVLDAMPYDRAGGGRAATLAAANALPAAPCVALEWRLGAEGGPIDVSQPLVRSQNGAALLAAAAAQHTSPAWARLGGLAAWWAQAQGSGLEAVWIEQDADGDDDPSVFLHLSAPVDCSFAERALVGQVADVDPETWRSAKDALEAADALRLHRSSLLGLMLSRTGALRLTFPDPADHAAHLLTAIGWNGDIAAAAAMVSEGLALAPRHQLVIDLAPSPMPHLGLEFTFAGPHEHKAFLALLDWFQANGWATEAARGFLGAWTGRLSPPASVWPDALVVSGMLGRSQAGPWLKRRTNHLKLVLQPAGSVTAKAYFGLELSGGDHER